MASYEDPPQTTYDEQSAMAIVLSVNPGSSAPMQENVDAAANAIEHLRRLGFALQRIERRKIAGGRRSTDLPF